MHITAFTVITALFILAVVISVVIAHRYAHEIWFDLFIFLISGIVGAIAVAIIFGTSGIGSSRITRSYQLVALSNGSSVEGHFFLGSGTLNSKSVYSYVTGTGTSGYHLRTVDAPATTIYTSDDQPRIDTVTGGCPRLSGWPFGCMGNIRHNVYIPEGSVYSGYSVDVRH